MGDIDIGVNAVAPAIVQTRIFERFIPGDKLDDAMAEFHSLHSIGRNGTVEDVAETIVFLLSDKTSWVTKQFDISTQPYNSILEGEAL
ncbi:SDR family oxidoreductase [Rhodococcus sovatensis]|uniref:SDR family oxidoreductase n=1 Tax=Rhodococcus sovatensis TaxID=1805840 RepID=A0ABZ2PL89_9NOCA